MQDPILHEMIVYLPFYPKLLLTGEIVMITEKFKSAQLYFYSSILLFKSDGIMHRGITVLMNLFNIRCCVDTC